MTSSLHNEWGGTWLPGTLISFRPERWPRLLLDKRNLLDLWLPDSRRRSTNTSNQTRRCDKQMSPNLKTSALLPGRSYICESNRNEISQKMSSLIKSNQWSAPSSDSLSCNSRSATAPRLFRNPCFRYSVHSWVFALEKTFCWFLTLTRFFDASCQNKSVALLQGDQMTKTLFRHNQQKPAFLLLDLKCLASVCLAIVKLEEMRGKTGIRHLYQIAMHK